MAARIAVTIGNWEELLRAGLAEKLPAGLAQSLANLASRSPAVVADAEVAVLGLVADEIRKALEAKGAQVTVVVENAAPGEAAHIFGPVPVFFGGAAVGFVIRLITE